MLPINEIPQQPWMNTVAALLGVLVVAWLIRILGEAILKRVLSVVVAHTKWAWDDALLEQGFFHRCAQIVVPLAIKFSLPLLPGLAASWELLLNNLTSAMVVLYIALALNAALNTLQFLYARHDHLGTRSIKTYVQVVKLILFLLAAVVIIALLIDKSPLILLSGLGAMSAVLLLVFRDTLLSFVASVQLASNDMLRVGDWIEMPQLGADGDVVDIALHTVKVQNWDNTITTIPTWRLIAESFKNWRGMKESGGRRIKRSLRLDTHSVHFLDADEIARLSKLKLLRDYLADKTTEIGQANAALGDAAKIAGNQRRLTNIGTFRAYALVYLKQNPLINQSMTCMVRQLEPSAEGVPIEVYCFTRTTDWLPYEQIQGDIFDHLLAILPEFGLALYQQPSGGDLRGLTLR